MAERIRLGFKYFFDNHSNSGIVNYIYNIIAALNTLDDAEKPDIVVFYTANAPIEQLRSIGYPLISFVLYNPHPSNYFLRKGNSAVRKLSGIDIYKRIKYLRRIDCLYPYFEFLDHDFKPVKKKIHWLVDFNNRAFPDHYADKAETMNAYQHKLAYSKELVALSSETLRNELARYYPGYSCSVHILRFASSLPVLDDEGFEPIRQKLRLDEPYLMSPNQFWEHKNQIVVLDAIAFIKEKRPDLKFKVLFTGSLEVNRGKGLYVDLLKKKLQEYGIEEYATFLGVIDRKEQLLLMKNAVALLQPSLYEGWSTLVEEAKALNKFIILSDLPVHREQMKANVDFFDPHNAQELAKKIIGQIESPAPVSPIDYHRNIKEFGKVLLNVFRA